MKKELEALIKFSGTPQFDVKLEALYKKYKDEPSAKSEIAGFIKSGLRNTGQRLEEIETAIKVRELIGDSADTIPLSFIAEKYFSKTRQWMYQRVNGNIVNGKVSTFTAAELKTFAQALTDISENLKTTSKKIASLSVNG